jgi:hypothetical protein
MPEKWEGGNPPHEVILPHLYHHDFQEEKKQNCHVLPILFAKHTVNFQNLDLLWLGLAGLEENIF